MQRRWMGVHRNKYNCMEDCYGRLHQEVQHPTSPRLHNNSLPRLSIYTYPRPLSPLTIHSDSSPSEWRTVRPFGSHSGQVSMKLHPENFDRYSPNIFSRFRGRLFRPSCTNRGSTASTYFQNVSASSQGSELHSPRPPRYGRSHVLKPVDRHRNVRICRAPRCVLVEGDSLKLARGGILPVRQKGAFRGRPCRGDRRAWSNAVPV